MTSKQTSSNAHAPPTTDTGTTAPADSDRESLIKTLTEHDDIERVVEYDDTSLDGVMVILDWVTDSTIENGTRIIHDKQYTGEIRTVSEFIRELDGVRKTRAGKSGIARYTMHLEFTGQ